MLTTVSSVSDRGLHRKSFCTDTTFTIVGNACPLTRITTTAEVPLRKPTALESDTPKPVVIQIALWYLDSGCSKHMTEDRSQLTNFVNKFLGTVTFGNDHLAKILGYGDYQIGNVMISRASKTKSWLWNRRLSYLNFGEINHLARHSLVRGLPKLKFEKDHLCSACVMGKSKKKPHKPKSEDTNQEKLYLLHMDLCEPMRLASVNGKKYILIIVDDYSRFTWVKCLRSKDEAPDFIIKFLKMIQKVGISHETSVARSPQQNGVIERRNRTLIEAARTMLIYAKAPLFLWAEAVATAYFDELTAMASEHSSSGPALHEMTPATITMEEELNEFERLEVWELVPRPDKVMVITLKWIYKVKLDEVRGILKNKARLVARGYRQEKGINFEESFALVARS
ncbi:retrovirus-related pol polyprotein from transposon TNT 1-94 [Tanacetum coccineum]